MSSSIISKNADIDQLKLIPIVDIWHRYGGGELKRVGKELAGRCSRHGTDTTPSLMINPEKNSFYCFGCQSGGDTIELSSWLLGCDFKESVNTLSRDFNINRAQPKRPASNIVYTYADATGNLIYQVSREDKGGKKQIKQRRPDGDGGWIWNLKGVEPLPYRLPELLKAIADGNTIYVVEGEKCVDALIALGLPATTNSGGAGKWTNKHSQYFPAETKIIILPDNDNPGRNHAQIVARELIGRDCKVKIIDLQGLSDVKTAKGTGQENGADIFDWLAAGHTKEELLALVNASECLALGTVPPTEENKYAEWQSLFQGTFYKVDSQGYLCKIRTTKDGGMETVRLADFAARITKEIVKDDGQASQLMFEIDGVLAGGRPLSTVNVSSSKFSYMCWPVECWGAAANINPGIFNKDSVRHAIQTTGRNCPKEIRFTHTGWREVGDKWVYLHGGGAVGANDITVDLEEAKLTNYCLLPITNIQEAAKATLDCLKLAPPEVTYPILATIFLAPLCEPMRQAHCEPSFILWMSGMTGAQKSTLAGLFLSHFGDFTGKALPGSFKDTENTLERKAFLLKDTVFCIDDYHPVGSVNEKRTMEKKAHSLIRGYGDRVGRGRMNSDISLRQSYIPRGLCIVTGEDIPALGQSATARILNIELQRGQADLPLLTQLQGQAHLLAQTMTGYIDWLRPQIKDLSVKYKDSFIDLRAAATAGSAHGRIPETVASLYLGAVTLFFYMAEIGAINESQKEKELLKTWEILIKLGENQGRSIAEDAPTEKFLSALQELIAAKRVIVRNIADTYSGNEDGAEQIGWQDGLYYYLLPGLTYKVVCQFYQQQGGIFSVGEKTLWKHLEAAGKIQVYKDSRQTNRTMPKEIPAIGERKKLLWLKKDAITL